MKMPGDVNPVVYPGVITFVGLGRGAEMDQSEEFAASGGRHGRPWPGRVLGAFCWRVPTRLGWHGGFLLSGADSGRLFPVTPGYAGRDFQ
ncbi:MAG: hypothetical protein RL077_5869 [Verrucomicrobiota bacterium]|jgi:hypothetical protein